MNQTAYERMLDALASAGCRVTQRGGGRAAAQCPAHEDRDPSLSVSQGEVGVLIKCHAGCAVDDVLEALKLTRRDLFDNPRDQRAGYTVVDEYPYVDEHGEVLYVKERRWPKAFMQYRDTPQGRQYRLGDVRRVLYRLPEVQAAIADGRPVYLAEGEKDADALAAAGVTATTWAEGAWKPGEKAKWRRDYSEALRGAAVVIVADDDEPGRNTAKDIVRHLEGTAAAVRIVLPAEGKDASDHLAGGRAVTALRPFVEREVPSEPDDEDEASWLAEAPRPLVARPMTSVPEFPVDVLPDVLARHVRAVAEASLTPVDFAAVACLGAISAACAGRARVRVNRTFEQPLNVYLVPVAGPGEGKTPAFAPFESVLFDWQTQCREAGREERARAQANHEAASERVEAARTAIRQALKASGKPKLRVVGRDEAAEAAEADVDELQHQLGEALLRAEEAPAPVTPTVVITGNATPEALLRVMAENHGRLAVMATEGRIVDIVSGAYSTKADITPLLMAYDGSLIDGHRIGRDVPDVEDPALTICVAVQPVVWVEAMGNRQLRDRGLIPRVLACYPKPMIGRRDRPLTEVPELVETPALDRLRGLLQEAARHANTVLRLSGPAYAAFEDYRRELDRRSPEGRDLNRLAAWAAKHAARAVRLAGLLHLADDPEGGWVTPVTAEDFARARAVADYYVAHQLALLDAAEEDESTGDDSAPAYLLRYLERRDPKPEGWSLRDLSRAVSKSRFPGGESDLRGALEVLADYGWVHLQTPEKQRQGGRAPSLRVMTHPAMHGEGKGRGSSPADFADDADSASRPAETTSASTTDKAPQVADIAPPVGSNVGNVGNVAELADNQNPWSEPTVGIVGKVGKEPASRNMPPRAVDLAVTERRRVCACPNGSHGIHRDDCPNPVPCATGHP